MPENIEKLIKEMQSPDDFESIAMRIVNEGSKELILLYKQLHSKRASLLREKGEAQISNGDEWSKILFEAFVYCSVNKDWFSIFNDDVNQSPKFYPQWNGLARDCFGYYWEQAKNNDENPLIRAVYLQGLWELRKLWEEINIQDIPKPIEIAKETIQAHAEAARWISQRDYDPAARGLNTCKHWRTAIRLAIQIGQPDLLSKRLADLRENQLNLIDKAPHWALGLVECEVDLASPRGQRNRGLVSDDRLRELLNLLDQINNEFIKPGALMEHMEQKLLDTQITVERLLGNEHDPKELARRNAQLLEGQATRSLFDFSRSELLKQAAGQYQQAGLRGEASRCLTSARDAIQKVIEAGFFKETAVTTNIEASEIEKMVRPFFEETKTATQVLERMAKHFFAPSLERDPPPGRVGYRSIVSQIAMTVPVVDDRTLAELHPNSPAQENFQEQQDLLLEINICSCIILRELFNKLRSEKDLKVENLVSIFRNSGFINENDLPFLRIAVERYLAGDLVSAIHLLVPRIEQIIRRILRKAGVNTTALLQGAMRERLLGELLRAQEAMEVLSSPLARLLQATLSEEWGLNLRNRVAHGLINEAECSQSNADRLLHTVILLSQIRLVAQEDMQEE